MDSCWFSGSCHWNELILQGVIFRWGNSWVLKETIDNECQRFLVWAGAKERQSDRSRKVVTFFHPPRRLRPRCPAEDRTTRWKLLEKGIRQCLSSKGPRCASGTSIRRASRRADGSPFAKPTAESWLQPQLHAYLVSFLTSCKKIKDQNKNQTHHAISVWKNSCLSGRFGWK